MIEKLKLLIAFYWDVKNNKLHIYELMNRNKKENNKMSEMLSNGMPTNEKPTMEEMEKRELIARINGMSKEELEIVADHIPVELCYNRIGKELKKARMLDESITRLAANVRSGIDA